MNILVTGASGFIGSRFAVFMKEYIKKEDKLILLTSGEIPGFNCILHNDYRYTVLDFIERGIDRIDKVIHIGHYLQEVCQDNEVCKGNISSINNTIHLVDHLPNIPDTFVYCSSMAVYGINRMELIDEQTALQPENPYAVSKIMIEMFLEEWAEKNHVNLHILRLSHVYGPNDRRIYTIPVWLQAAQNQQPIRLFANPDMKRNCLYIDDCCRLLIRAAYLDDSVKIINLVSSHNAAMKEIAELCRIVSKNPYEIEVLYKQDEDKETGLEFKNSNLREIYLGKESVSLSDGLKHEYEYYARTNRS